MLRKIIPILLLLAVSTAQAQVNQIQVTWNLVLSATSYTVGFSTVSRTTPGAPAYTLIPAGLLTTLLVDLPTEGVPYFLASRASNAAGDSEWSREASAFPRPEIVTVASACAPKTGGGVSCTAQIAGFNFGPDASASITYPGVTVISSTRLDSRSMTLAFDIEQTALGGAADLVISQGWAVTPGTELPGDTGPTSGLILDQTSGELAITPVILPSGPGNTRLS